jgi:small subunit ribosomal protein S2
MKENKKTAEIGSEEVAASSEPQKVHKKAIGEDYFAGFDFSKLEVNIEEMFKNGVHFGHHKSRKNPKMDEFIFGTRNGISIFDLQKTVTKLKTALDFINQAVSSGQEILFVGTKKQAKRLVESAARRCDVPFVSERWLGGTFTNYPVISKRTKYLRDGQEKMKKGGYAQYTKFEQMKIAEELEKLEKKMGGIKNMTRIPDVIFALSVIDDDLAIKEARARKIPVVALVDTNVSPDYIDFPIPANEDAVSSIALMLAYVSKAVLEGKAKASAIKAKNNKEENNSK